MEPEPVDMSPAALRGRLEQLRQLYRLMMHLKAATPQGTPATSK